MNFDKYYAIKDANDYYLKYGYLWALRVSLDFHVRLSYCTCIEILKIKFKFNLTTIRVSITLGRKQRKSSFGVS